MATTPTQESVANEPAAQGVIAPKIATYGGTAALPTQYSYNYATGKSTPTGFVFKTPAVNNNTISSSTSYLQNNQSQNAVKTAATTALASNNPVTQPTSPTVSPTTGQVQPPLVPSLTAPLSSDELAALNPNVAAIYQEGLQQYNQVQQDANVAMMPLTTSFNQMAQNLQLQQEQQLGVLRASTPIGASSSTTDSAEQMIINSFDTLNQNNQDNYTNQMAQIQQQITDNQNAVQNQYTSNVMNYYQQAWTNFKDQIAASPIAPPASQSASDVASWLETNADIINQAVQTGQFGTGPDANIAAAQYLMNPSAAYVKEFTSEEIAGADISRADSASITAGAAANTTTDTSRPSGLQQLINFFNNTANTTVTTKTGGTSSGSSNNQPSSGSDSFGWNQ